MDKLIIYLICINILGAVLDGVTAAKRRRTSHKALSVLLGIIAIAGGAPGMIIAFALCDRTASKTNMMLRVFTVCVCDRTCGVHDVEAQTCGQMELCILGCVCGIQMDTLVRCGSECCNICHVRN